MKTIVKTIALTTLVFLAAAGMNLVNAFESKKTDSRILYERILHGPTRIFEFVPTYPYYENLPNKEGCTLFYTFVWNNIPTTTSQQYDISCDNLWTAVRYGGEEQ